MATFYYNRFSEESINSQWVNHLQSNAYVKDIDKIISKNSNELQNTMQYASPEQLRAFQQVCGTLDNGFREINSHLSEMNYNISELRGEINEMAAMLDWKLSMLIEEQRVTNQLLGHIAQLLWIPDSQKQRVYHIEQGLKYLKNAFIEDIDSSFFIDALEEFKEAEKIEKKDYITLNRIGQIYFFSKKFMDIPLAEEYFLKSAREAIVEANAGGTTTSNNLLPYGSNNLVYSQNLFKTAAAESYLYASRTCYLQNKLPEATELAAKAYNLIPEFVEAGFEQAKYLAANGQEEEAANVLKTVIGKDRLYSIKTINDKDLFDKPSILKLLTDLNSVAKSKADSGYKRCIERIRDNSEALNVVKQIKEQVSKNSFLTSMKAIDLLNCVGRTTQDNFGRSLFEVSNSQIIQFSNIPNNHNLIEFIDKENKFKAEFKQRMNYLENENNNRKLIAGLKGAGKGFLFAIIPAAIWSHWTWLIMIICIGIGAFIAYFIEE